jgi:two-component system sensor histidine kinase UhpB
VSLRHRQGRGVELEVADDGRGFAFDESEGGLGIAGMRERALLVGGDMQVESRLDSGTRVRLTVPLEPADRSREWKRNGHMPSQSSKRTHPRR